MLILAKVLAIAVLVWFYTTARDKGEPAINWAVTGFIGYVIVWGLIYALINKLFGTNAKGSFVIMQIPALCAIAATYFIRQKLCSNVAEKEG
jgi:uncharacterized membrane protein YuzA (DUF378 family)